MTKYEQLIENLKTINFEQAENMEDEINVIIHKLKFLSTDNFPNTIILDQNNSYTPLSDSIIAEKVKIAGGKLIDDLNQNPDCIIIIQQNENLYSEIINVLDNAKSTNAVSNDNIYIIQNINFNKEDNNYLIDTEILAEIQQPKYFVFGRDGIDWVKFNLQ